MSKKLPPSLEDTISIYRSRFLSDLDDENDDVSLLDSLDESDLRKEYRDNDSKDEQDLRKEYKDSDAKEVTRTQKSRLPRDLAGLMGQANVSFARGEINDAILMCQEVIRLAPKCAEPFISLAEYYGEAEDEEKAEQLYLIAAYLQPSNTHLWVKVAESAARRREFRLAATCYTKAIRANKNDFCASYHLSRCHLYEKLGDQKKALRGYENLISALGPDDEKFGLQLARGIARIYQAEGKIEACIRTLEGALDKYSNQFSSEDIHQLGECYNSRKLFTRTIHLISSKCQVKVTINQEPFGADAIVKPVDKVVVSVDSSNRFFNLSNRCLLIVALISIGFNEETLQPLVQDLHNLDLQSHRSSLFKVAQAYFEQGIFTKAREILLRLTTLRDSQAASVWLLYSRCLKNLNEIEEAISAYRKVLTYNPDDYSSRLALSNLLSVQGRVEEALEVTKQPLFTDKPVDIPLLYQSCKLLEQSGSWDEYCESAKSLLLTDMFYTKHPKQLTCMITSKSFRTRQENLRAVQRECNQDPHAFKQLSVGAKLDPSTMFEIFLCYTHVLFHIKKDIQELKRICFSAYTCPTFECYESSIDFYTAVTCVLSADKDFSYNHLKILASRNPDYCQTWNLLSIAMSNIYKDLRHGRFCLRQFLKNPDVIPLAIFNGHNALMSGSYKHALGEYSSVFRDRPNDPFIAFCIALTFLSLSCQRYVSSKYLCLFQMIAFLHTYLELRGTCQEAMYNIGRVFHQMNMLDKAVIFYKKALDLSHKSGRTKVSEDDLDDDIFDVRREAAFNLALIYKNSQSRGLAYQVLKDYFTI